MFPGLGHAFAGRAARATAVAAPALFVLGIPLGIVLGGGPRGLVQLLLHPAVILAVLALNALLLGWRAFAVLDAYRVARAAVPGPVALRPRPRPVTRGVVLVLLAGVLATHGLIAWVGWNGYDLVTGVFQAGGGRGPAWGDDVPTTPPSPSPEPTPAPTPEPGQRATPTPAPTPTPEPVPYWAEDGRLNLLLLGGDAGPGRTSIRTDSMILLTVDLATDRAAMASFPRNLLEVPLPDPYAGAFAGGRFPDLLNALWRYADEHPGPTFPGTDATRGYRAVSAAIGHLAGVDIDGLAYLDLNGFVRFIDALGGLDMTVPYRIYDAHYPNENGNGYRELVISAGTHHFDGRTALAYARSRHQDSDYGRISRQQLVLLALRRQTNVCELVPRLPDLVRIAKESMYTNIPVEDVPLLMNVAAKVQVSSIAQLQFTPGEGYPEAVTKASLARMRAAIRDVFANAVPEPSAAPSHMPGESAEPTDDGLDLSPLHC